jgi:ATP-dependent RNA helicase RhlE
VAISLCDPAEAALLRDIEKLIRMSIPATDHRSFPQRAQHSAIHDSAGRPPAQPRGDRRPRQRGQTSFEQRQHESPRGTSGGGIAAVAFLQRDVRPARGPRPSARRARQREEFQQTSKLI